MSKICTRTYHCTTGMGDKNFTFLLPMFLMSSSHTLFFSVKSTLYFMVLYTDCETKYEKIMPTCTTTQVIIC